MTTKKPMHTLFVVLKSGTWMWFSHDERSVLAVFVVTFMAVRNLQKKKGAALEGSTLFAMTQSMPTPEGISEEPNVVIDLDEVASCALTPGPFADGSTFGISPCPTLHVQRPETPL